ncbi:MAG: phenylalanine--tRNA ligase subunit beta [Armatimonadota bacterium]|nr:phenylalanine--tRNA ligase subunit beta [Armatimonadota bacterium]MDR7427473.1 phenylalanine--tRNA ligase subunit beta [Armatimonadota bacterium]MDR7463821.1 phenylalanine--tRNA ligase subunit beta [Armatimonadota bacterium]MDR7469967.1 phenylalanine--tRNA ligase subunit beta [Armatimonadota bacterium]MDR7474474.1 phenylalanine--tRNA ligase subunit beta [Armatimonadota bacterium]
MRVPLSWLREFVPLPEEPEALRDRLAMLGFGHEPVQWVGEEAVLDLEVASNRPDLLSVLGVAREIAAAWERELTLPRITLRRSATPAATVVDVAVEDVQGCPRYTAHVISGVRVGASPPWMVRRLEAAGIRSINNVVDVTNYVMLEQGQPLHAFDLDRLAGPRILVRRAHPGERLVTLDGVDRPLDPQVLVITDSARPVAIAGVMGGADTEIGAATTRVLLEAAVFHPAQVRRTARRLGLRTESSARFERGLDPRGVLRAARRAAGLIAEVAGGRVLTGAVDVYPHPAPPTTITLRLPRIARVLGVEVPQATVLAILRRLGCRVVRRASHLVVTAPVGRVDLEREEDLIEEVARHYGYDRIPEAMPREVVQAGSVAPSLQAEARVRDLLVRAGFVEAITLSLVSPEVYQRLGVGADDLREGLVPLQNPLLADHTHLRAMLLPGLLEVLRVNLSRRVEDVHLFEIGRIFRPGVGATAGRVEERRALAVAMHGRLARGWNLPPAAVEVTFFHLKGLLEELGAVLRLSLQAEPAAAPWLHPGRGARLLADGAEAGLFGELHPEVAERFGLSGRVYAAEVDLEELLRRAAPRPRFDPLPRHPSVDRDLAIFVPADVPQAEVLRVIHASGGPLLESAELFDVYTGPQAPPGQRSLAYSLRFRAADRTLTAAEADGALGRIQAALREKLGATPRG